MFRNKFIEVSEGIFRELGFPPPAMLHEESLPLVMELEIEGRAFELIHSPTEIPEKVLVVCKLGVIPEGEPLRGMQELLKENLSQMRTFGEWYGVNPGKHDVHLMCHLELDNVTAPSVISHMKTMASCSSDWQNRFFNFSGSGNIFVSEVPNSFLA